MLPEVVAEEVSDQLWESLFFPCGLTTSLWTPQKGSLERYKVEGSGTKAETTMEIESKNDIKKEETDDAVGTEIRCHLGHQTSYSKLWVRMSL